MLPTPDEWLTPQDVAGSSEFHEDTVAGSLRHLARLGIVERKCVNGAVAGGVRVFYLLPRAGVPRVERFAAVGVEDIAPVSGDAMPERDSQYAVHYGQVLTDTMAAAGMTTDVVAFWAQTNRHSVHAYKKGVRQPFPSTHVALCRALDTDPFAFLVEVLDRWLRRDGPRRRRVDAPEWAARERFAAVSTFLRTPLELMPFEPWCCGSRLDCVCPEDECACGCAGCPCAPTLHGGLDG
ncbi:MAG TPA: hypothetical protein VJ914_40230 [Pseudonocardiaceae bacterium]|nr:hypothetical protein [Pseudonocardiaceae bacterium]